MLSYYFWVMIKNKLCKHFQSSKLITCRNDLKIIIPKLSIFI